MYEILFEVSLILVLILINGFFAAAEIAVITARRSHLQALAATDHHSAQRVLALREDPGRFLSTVQIGITLVGTLASAIGGASVVRFLEPWLAALPLPGLGIYAEVVALLLVVAVLSYLSLVGGELVPKELALGRAEALAMMLSRPLTLLARLVHPLVWVLTRSTRLILRPVAGLMEQMFPSDRGISAVVIGEEILAMLRDGVAAGLYHPSEQALVRSIFRFADRQVWDVMKPRTDISAISANARLGEVLDTARERRYTRYPVYEDNLDQIVGVLHIKDLVLRADDLQRPARELVRTPLLVPGSLRLTDMLRRFRKGGTHLAIVMDEYGGTAGLITLEDLLEEIVGRIEDEYPHPEPAFKRHPDGTLTVPGTLPLLDLAEILGVNLPDNIPYDTVAGFMLYRLGHIPKPGEEITHAGYRMVVQEMEARRITQVAVIPPLRAKGSSRAD